jgi:hypothetical protein
MLTCRTMLLLGGVAVDSLWAAAKHDVTHDAANYY